MTRRVARTEWAANIARLLEQKGLTQKELAEQAGVSANQMTLLLTQDVNAGISQFREIARILEVPMWQLFAPADLAAATGVGVELGTPLTPEQYHLSNAPREATAQSPDVHDEAVRSKILATIRELASALEPPERGEEGRLIARRALAESQKVDHGSPSGSGPHRPSRRRRDSA